MTNDYHQKSKRNKKKKLVLYCKTNNVNFSISNINYRCSRRCFVASLLTTILLILIITAILLILFIRPKQTTITSSKIALLCYLRNPTK